MRFDGNLSNSWRYEESQQIGETNQITASDSSVLTTHQTIENAWISRCFLPKQRGCLITEKHYSVLGRIARAIFKGWNEVWKSD